MQDAIFNTLPEKIKLNLIQAKDNAFYWLTGVKINME